MKSCQFFNRTPKVEEVVLSVEPKSKAPSRSLSIPSARIQTPQVWSGELIQSGIWSTVQSPTAPQLRGFFWTTILLRRYRKNNRRDSLIRVYYFDVIDRGYPRHRSLWYGLNTATTNTTKLSRSYVKTVHSLVHHYLPRYVIWVCTWSLFHYGMKNVLVQIFFSTLEIAHQNIAPDLFAIGISLFQKWFRLFSVWCNNNETPLSTTYLLLRRCGVVRLFNK